MSSSSNSLPWSAITCTASFQWLQWWGLVNGSCSVEPCLYPDSLFVFDSTWLNLAQICTESPSFHLFHQEPGTAWSFFRCKLWLMSFWLESRMRHFHYCLSKCILLGAVKSMDACECAWVCVRAMLVWEWERKRERIAPLDDETHLMTFLIWFLPKPRLLRAWGSGGPDHLRKWDVWWLSSD